MHLTAKYALRRSALAIVAFVGCLGASALSTAGCSTDAKTSPESDGGKNGAGASELTALALPAGRQVDLLANAPAGGLWIVSHFAQAVEDAVRGAYFAQRLGDDLSEKCEVQLGMFVTTSSNFGVAPDGALAFGARGEAEGGHRSYRAYRIDQDTCAKADWFVDPSFDGYPDWLGGSVAVTDNAIFFPRGQTNGAQFVVAESDGEGGATNRVVTMMADNDDLGIDVVGLPARLADGTIAYAIRVPAAQLGDAEEVRIAQVAPATAKASLSADRTVKLQSRSVWNATLLPQPEAGLVVVVSSSDQTSDIRVPGASYSDVFTFGLSDDDPIAGWRNTSLKYPGADGTLLPRADESFVLGADGWLSAGLDGRDGLATGAFSVGYAALRVIAAPTEKRSTLPVEAMTETRGVKSVRIGSAAGSWVSSALRTASGPVVLAVWSSTSSNRIAGRDFDFGEKGGTVLLLADSMSALGALPQATTDEPCPMLSDACFECVSGAITDDACLGRDVGCTGQLVIAPTCACQVQSATPDDSSSVDACFANVASANAGGKLTAEAVLGTCGSVCR